MKQLIVLLISILIFSCADPTKKPDEKPETLHLEEIKEVRRQKENFEQEKQEFQLQLIEAQRTFSSDSASLADFYLRTFPAETKEDFERQINRLENLMSTERVGSYQLVSNELKPLLIKVIETKTINPEEAIRLSKLYTLYDNLRSESLFSGLFTMDENYNLVWNSIQMIVKRTPEDTAYLRALIELNDGISANVELSEEMQTFLPEGITNNPEGFLTMFEIRPEQEKERFAIYATRWEDPIPELMTVFDSLSKTSQYDLSARALIDKLTIANNR